MPQFGSVRRRSLAVALVMLALLAASLPAQAATTSYRKSGVVSSADSAKRRIGYRFPVSGRSTIDATLSWPDVPADLNIILRDDAGAIVASTNTDGPNPETLTYSYTGTSAGTWSIYAFARRGTGAFTLDWSVTDDAAPPPPANQPPTTQADTASTPAGTAVTINVLANDADADGPSPMSIGTVTNGTKGTAAKNGTKVTYTPNSSATGSDTFTYKACDAGGACSAATTVTVTIGGSSSAPVANNDSASATTGTNRTIDVLANDTGSGLTVGTVSNPPHGTATDNGSNVTYKSDAGYTGSDSFTYTACSGSTCSATATVSVTVSGSGSTASNYLRVWTAANIGSKRSFTQAEADEVARNFDMIVAGPAAFNGKVPGMHAANPKVKVLVYVNAAFVGKTQGPSSGAYPASWYMRDAGGNAVQSKYDNYMMDISLPAWVENRKSTCKNNATSTGYDGCSLDMLGSAPLDAGYTKSAPINPATKQKWTPADYYRTTTKLVVAVQDAAAPLQVDGNGLRAGNQYFDSAAPSKQLLQGCVEAVAEAFVRVGTIGIDAYRNETGWRQDVDMLVDAGRSGHGVSTLTKIWTDAPKAKKDAVHEYTLATFLLGTDGKSFFNVSYEDGLDVTIPHPWWGANIGTPSGSYPNYQKVGSVFMRTFTGAVVVVNPTTAAANVTLPSGSWRDINGGTTRSGSVSVPATTGWVLLK